MDQIKAPFPYFGGKSKIAAEIWDRFGNVPNYIEPFFGSGAVLLSRPHKPGIETVTDTNCYLANFWRALQSDPEGVAYYADWPVNEADQHARHRWLVTNVEFRERMQHEPDYYDSKAAGYWVWGQSIWIGSGWCETIAEHTPTQIPHLSSGGMGIYRSSQTDSLINYIQQLAARMRKVRVCCGDWSRICGPSPTYRLGLTGVFLDPPYSIDSEGNPEIYGGHQTSNAAEQARQWAIENGGNPELRIALCGYQGEEMPQSWEAFTWKRSGGYGPASGNRFRERIWFSPHCLRQPLLFDESNLLAVGID